MSNSNYSGIETTTTFPNLGIGLSLPNLNLFPIFKGGLVAIAIIYAIVSIVVIKQIYLMIRTVKSKTSGVILAMGYINLFIVFIILLFALYL